jgi:hypothetical protein
MTPDEIRIVQALAGCRFAPATSPKRLVHQLVGRDRSKPLTDRQRAFLWAVAWSWRRQLPDDLVDLALQYSGGVGIRGRQVCEERLREHVAKVAAERATQPAPAPTRANPVPRPAIASPSYHSRRHWLPPVDGRQGALFA